LVKSEIIKELHQKNPALKRSQIEAIFNNMLNSISKSLIEGKPVELRNFGRFSLKEIKARYNARNPKTGEIIFVPDKKKISFKMSKYLKQEINKKNSE
jgi:integration host factor subunit beta|tara:strand:- start:1017 stop:1310 length:294 start_codon:yes stop_codon:yes gene_type:complete